MLTVNFNEMDDSKIVIAIHGGAGSDSSYIQNHISKYESGLNAAILEGYAILQKGGNALDAVTTAVMALEDDELFNAGRGSALNIKGEVEMDASIMEGQHLRAGATAMVDDIKNPILLARTIMEKTNHVFIAGEEASCFAKEMKIETEEAAYFKTVRRQEELLKEIESTELPLKKRNKGTVGAVALDLAGNLAAATSTGGTVGKLPGRIGDSCIIGAGCYADNKTCAVSGTGDGEFLIRGVIAHSIAMAMQLKGFSLQEACNYVLFERSKAFSGDLGVIGVDQKGEIGIAFNSERMHRAWIDQSGKLFCKVYA